MTSHRKLLILAITAASLYLQSCASTHMKAFIGKDIRYVVLSDGQPENAMDMPDDKRAFQFRFGGGAVAVPTRNTTNGQIQMVGNSAYYSEQRLESPGGVFQTPGCLVTYFAKWDAQTKGWIVDSIQYPKRMFC